ncbi:hypothetical protein [Klebsiella pneumoniae]|uniref:hypothetical protein n=1 Tax=Klebsiella pneumoniae TaxID=573 RepID=UPI0039855A78
MTKSTITREQLEEWVAQFDEDGGCDATDRQLEALIRQSLAAMDSEPLAWTDEQELRDVNRGGCGYLFTVNPVPPHADERRIILLYRHAQPAQVVPEEATPDSIEILASGRCRDHVVYQWDEDQRNAAADSWNACRAAMLHAGNSPAKNGVAPAQSGNSPAIPDGYVLVPKEATKEILDEFDSIIDYGAEDSVDAWHRLLAAATQEVKP